MFKNNNYFNYFIKHVEGKMSNRILTCSCCLKSILSTESRIQTNNKTHDIFNKFIGITLPIGILCSKCNINLLTFDAFQQEIKRKHEEKQASAVKKPEIKLINPRKRVAIISDDDVANKSEDLVKHEPEEEIIDCPAANEAIPTTSNDESFSNESTHIDDENQIDLDSDNDDVIEIPTEKQEPIDLDEISDEPEPKKQSEPKETIYKCEHCTSTSSKKEIIIAHIKKSHTHKCIICEKVYPTEDRLRSHEMRVHGSLIGNKRKQALVPLKLQDQLKFRLKSKPFGRPWPSVVAKRARNDD